MHQRDRGLALIVVVGVLGVLSVLAVAFVTMAQLERKASAQRVYAVKATLLARSGIEDALARLGMGQDPAYGGEDWNGDGLLSPGVETAAQVYQPGVLNVADCPVRHAMRPSFFTRDGAGLPALQQVDGWSRGYSGLLTGDQTPTGNTHTLKVVDMNALIYINGGALDASVRADPDGPGAAAADFPMNPNAATEVAPLLSNGIKNYNDASMEGANGFLVRLLNNLDAILTNNATSNLGVQVVSNRPVGGYKSVADLQIVLSPARYNQFKNYLTVTAWVDPSVVKPQPMNGRPFRFQDIDDAHRIGAAAAEISGVTTTLKGKVQLNPPSGLHAGTEADPWSQTITATNDYEGPPRGQPFTYAGYWDPAAFTYSVSWERNFVYAWSQLRLAPPALEPRAPISINTAPNEILASVFLGLKGTYLDVWDGSAGWDGGFGWFTANSTATSTDSSGNTIMDPPIPPSTISLPHQFSTKLAPAGTYGYPSPGAEDTPWHRTRVDYGMNYDKGSSRPWYGPTDYNPQAAPTGGGGKPLIQAAPLGRLKEIPPITRPQALAVATELRRRISQSGPFRTWAQFNAFVDGLPSWEDLDEDGMLDGAPYTVPGELGNYARRTYRREDLNSDNVFDRQVFTMVSGDWAHGPIGWADPGKPKTSLPAGQVPGLTFPQKDLIKAMANPNTDLNDFNPDANRYKEVDKTDLAGIAASAVSYAHTTELSLDSMGYCSVQSAGRVLSGGGRLLALRQLSATVKTVQVYRDTTQADFMRDYVSGTRSLSQIFAMGGALPSGVALSADQPLVSYPESQTVSGGSRAADAAYDGQISLGFNAPGACPVPTETLLGSLFDTGDAPPNASVPDLRGPLHERLLKPAGQVTGNIFPDGVYSEKDRAIKFIKQGIVNPPEFGYFYVAGWVKPHWFPEASPRAHALISLSVGKDGIDIDPGWVPMDDIVVRPVGLYFVPARNNFLQAADADTAYAHNATSTKGYVWPSRSLLWGTIHSLYMSDNLNRRGILNTQGDWNASPTFPFKTNPVGRLEGHRWHHVAAIGERSDMQLGVNKPGASWIVLGTSLTSTEKNGGEWNASFGAYKNALSNQHSDGTDNHLRFGEVAGLSNMNYMADATFANIRAGVSVREWLQSEWLGKKQSGDLYKDFFTDTGNPTTPAVLGRYYKEDGATYISSNLPVGIQPLRATWTEIPCDLWFDKTDNITGGAGKDGWLDTLANDQCGAGTPANPLPNGLRDVRIDLEVWDDVGTATTADDVLLGHFSDPAGPNVIPSPKGRLYYKAVFVNEWDPTTRANYPLDVTPFLDDVTITYLNPGGIRVLSWEDLSD